MKISGPFTVNMQPLENYADDGAGNTIGRMLLEKTYSGSLTATSQGAMLTGMSPVKGSAGYVAVESVKGELAGKAGSFLLQHFGIMDGDTSRLILEVVPQSGTGALTGLSGTMEIRREEGKHFYDFDYTLS